MYILLQGTEAIIIDPFFALPAVQMLKRKGITNIIILPTHEHYDHISGINAMKEIFNCKVIACEMCSQNMANPIRNASAHFEALFIFCDNKVREAIKSQNIQPYKTYADEVFSGYKCFKWNNHNVEIIETPGHSEGSVCIIIDNENIFTGDSLIKGKPTITRLPGGNKKAFREKTIPFFLELPNQSIIFPGHGNHGKKGEFMDILLLKSGE
jgi:glyoxylase-like metal-dependent hydrolase (beta-lactamase superfamily II)